MGTGHLDGDCVDYIKDSLGAKMDYYLAKPVYAIASFLESSSKPTDPL